MQSKKCCCCCWEHNTLQRTTHLCVCLCVFIVVDCRFEIGPPLFVLEVFLQPCYFMSCSLVEGNVCRVTPDCAVASGLGESVLVFSACAAVCE